MASVPAASTPTTDKFKIALCQLLTGADKSKNLDIASAAVNGAASKGANVVVLPECFNSPYATDQFPVFAEPIPATVGDICPIDHPTTHHLHQLAVKNKIFLIGGSFPERSGAKVYNTCLAIGPDGTLLAKHRKMHLFDISVPGGITFRESDTLSAGDTLSMIDTPYGRIGLGICYDMRFPQLAMALADQGCSMIVYPGAFNTTTGPVHWELLLRSRALDNQLYVVGCSPARPDGPGYPAYGHSTVIGPWGDVIATTGHDVDTVFADIDMARVPAIRNQIPITVQRRKELYRFEWTGEAPEVGRCASEPDQPFSGDVPAGDGTEGGGKTSGGSGGGGEGGSGSRDASGDAERSSSAATTAAASAVAAASARKKRSRGGEPVQQVAPSEVTRAPRDSVVPRELKRGRSMRTAK